MIKDAKLKKWFESQKDRENNELLKILGVEYAHLILDNGDDLYVTAYGLPFMENLRPENYWLDKEWFGKNSSKLSGTSSLYKVRTKTVNGRYRDIVMKWNRMGQDVPGVDESSDLLDAEFNSPFEEFSMVMELRESIYGAGEKIALQKPLAIYVPKDQADPSMLGRKEYKMKEKIRLHKEVSLDICRSYAMIYEWVKGIDITQAYTGNALKEMYLQHLTHRADRDFRKMGFIVRDRKPHHVIVKPTRNGGFLKNKKGEFLFGVVDYELLERLPHRDLLVKKIRRADYLKRQRDRFRIKDDKYHPNLYNVNIFGVDYIYGHVESTKGRLWVVGKDPYLFDYFLPERWEHTQRVKISVSNRMYHTMTKDNIHIVWKVSNMGIVPDMDPINEVENRILRFGYNSPFEEVALAIELSGRGIATTYPRAIYMRGSISEDREITDESRFELHKSVKMPDGTILLEREHEYIIIWGYWNGPDEKLARIDGDYYEGIDMLKALRDRIITDDEYINLLNTAKKRLLGVGVEDLNLRGNHIIISLNGKGELVRDEKGDPELRLCNFEFLRRKSKR
ncbi:MAG: hypothetical protein JXJ19_01510 [Elusimicrobia bacterium]|nr:hypothetical protein [Elusimicrobiota bacterium]